jgi:hypothetical protein
VGRHAPLSLAVARKRCVLFVERLDDQELAGLEKSLEKVTVDCTFG